MWRLYAMMLSICLSARLSVHSLVSLSTVKFLKVIRYVAAADDERGAYRVESSILVYCVREQGNILQQIVSPWFILECINTVPFIITVSLACPVLCCVSISEWEN